MLTYHTYEHVVAGRVVETVEVIDGDYEDTRLGCLALDRAPGADGWRLQGPSDDADPAPPADHGGEPTTTEPSPARPRTTTRTARREPANRQES